MKSTVLYGMMESGKTTLGRGLADRLELGFLDTDAVIEEFTGRTCRDIVSDPHSDFGAIQRQALLGLKPEEELVIATGGSVANDEVLAKHFGNIGVGVFLYVSPTILEARISAERIAALNNPKGLSFADLYMERIPAYERAADLILEITDPVEHPGVTLDRLVELRSTVE